MSKDLPGSHYCFQHQGDEAHYAPDNCEVCCLRSQLAAKDAEIAELKHERDEHRGVGIACEARAEKAERERDGWVERFKALTGYLTPDMAGNVLISTRAQCDAAEARAEKAEQDADNHRLDNQRLSRELDALREGRIPAKYGAAFERAEKAEKERDEAREAWRVSQNVHATFCDAPAIRAALDTAKRALREIADKRHHDDCERETRKWEGDMECTCTNGWAAAIAARALAELEKGEKK